MDSCVHFSTVRDLRCTTSLRCPTFRSLAPVVRQRMAPPTKMGTCRQRSQLSKWSPQRARWFTFPDSRPRHLLRNRGWPGALGVITKLTRDVQPRFMMQQYVYENLPLSELKEHFDAIESAAYSVSLFTDWQKDRINEVWLKKRMEEGRALDAPKEFFGAKRASRNLHPIADLPAENCTEQLGVPSPWYERLPHFRMGLDTQCGQRIAVRILCAARARDRGPFWRWNAYGQVAPYLMISEIRAIAADDLWMSPCYRQPCVTIHFTWQQDWPSVSRLLPIIERELAPFNPPSHWGKLFTMTAVTCLDSLIHVELRISALRRTRWACDSPDCCAVARRCTRFASMRSLLWHRCYNSSHQRASIRGLPISRQKRWQSRCFSFSVRHTRVMSIVDVHGWIELNADKLQRFTNRIVSDRCSTTRLSGPPQKRNPPFRQDAAASV